MNISKPIIYLKTNIIFAQCINLVVLTPFEDPLGELTMYQVITKAFKMFSMYIDGVIIGWVKVNCPSPNIFQLFLAFLSLVVI